MNIPESIKEETELENVDELRRRKAARIKQN
jgi:hypothetical protein